MQGQAGKRKTNGKVPSNTEQNCPRLFERPRFVCIMHAPLVHMRTVRSAIGRFPKVISLNGSCSSGYLLSMPHTQSPIRRSTEN
ncbi:AHL_G0030950.mRNA.1.CDS.1 [Saccharomyces cerevisiae]|nr:CPG_1a_G0030940.mRNA.1.CDS.1 [Saccharomyces cerevisiae]CAI4573091.1 AIE_G0030940.mRNA.1.CDS.1 [Saccharomyces cerevisiae]CAI4585530.1 AVB_G0031250.mRNA.1.CDS.1 [Saccharomyces cerevisiae]CAI4888149.1 AHL_G0030950.mRNA.1.CDS.1 [Saccharomyces cerevisiae]CAI6750884.1 AIE_G0030940.mRNA.1.CDS.1 [Saccharomyces cerevisiae]